MTDKIKDANIKAATLVMGWWTMAAYPGYWCYGGEQTQLMSEWSPMTNYADAIEVLDKWLAGCAMRRIECAGRDGNHTVSLQTICPESLCALRSGDFPEAITMAVLQAAESEAQTDAVVLSEVGKEGHILE